MMPPLFPDADQRRALRNWALVLSGPALLLHTSAIIALLAFADIGPGARNYIGTIGIIAEVLLSIPLLAYAVEVSLRTFKASVGGNSFEATGQDNGAAAAGDKLQQAAQSITEAGTALKQGDPQ